MSTSFPEALLWLIASAFEIKSAWNVIKPVPNHTSVSKPRVRKPVIVPPTLEIFQIPRKRSAEAEDTPTYTPPSKTLQPPSNQPVNYPAGWHPNRRCTPHTGSVSAEAFASSDLTWHPPSFKKDNSTKNRLRDILRKNILMTHLSLVSQLTVVDALEQMTVPAGFVVVHEGEEGDACYVVESGTLACSMKDKGYRCDYHPGQTFGELALMYGNIRAATITVSLIQATTPCVLWKLDRQTFKKIVLNATQPNLQAFREFIDEVALFSIRYTETLSMPDKMTLMANSHHLEYRAGDIIVEMGHETSERYMFLVQSGTVQIVKDGLVMDTIRKSDFFGERSILRDELPTANAVVKEACKVYRVPETVLLSFPEEKLDELKQFSANRFI